MRFAHLAALVALTCFSAQPAFGQGSLLSQVEQGLQPPSGAQSSGTQPSGYLGAELDDEGQMGKGVLVTRIRPGTPAEKSGLKANDLITQVDGKPVPNLDAYDAVAKRPPNSSMTMTIERDGKTQALRVTLGTRPAAPGGLSDANPAEPTPAPTTAAPPSSSPPGPTPSGAAPSLLPPTGAASPSTLPSPNEQPPRSSGIIAQPQTTAPPATETPSITSGAATGGNASLGVTLPPPGSSAGRAQRGAMIANVKPGSPAEQAGLKAGQMIVGLDGKRIENDDDLIAAIKARQPGQSVELSYHDAAGGQVRTVNVRLAQAGAAGSAGAAPTSGGAFAPRSSGGFSPSGGGFSAPTAPGTAPGATDAQRLSPGSRLLDRVERIADNLAPRPLSTVYNPQAFADLQTRVDQLEARLRALESKGGMTPTGSGAPAGSPTPGFGSPAVPSTTPGFGSPGGTSP
ncbi:MAG: PDZ domain-containing protein [Planctomycetia bacterium]|nr:PDZ domain-containing protein [Planctomycetia bacterium]